MFRDTAHFADLCHDAAVESENKQRATNSLHARDSELFSSINQQQSFMDFSNSTLLRQRTCAAST